MATDTYKEKASGDAVNGSQMRKIQNRKQALAWLKKAGWKCSRANFYKHIKAGKLPMSPAGTIDLEDLQIYAAAYLNPVEQPPDCRVVSAIHEMERTARIELLQARKRKLDFENSLAADRFLDKDKVHTAFAVRLGILETTLKNMYRTNAEPWLMACGADPAAAGILFNLMEKELDELLEYLGNLEELRVVVRKRTNHEN